MSERHDLRPPSDLDEPEGLLRRHPKLAILLIAAIAYGVLVGMALLVLVLLVRG